MQNLVNAANERFFKLTGHKLRLELTPKNDFEVRDFMNNGQTRHVKTLSGGQTFQASLSLALALADSIHYQRQTTENFFFLDEGFGSLDRESLQMVFETLKALRAENRIVGIISHVEELQQEIDAYIKITNTPESGSVVVSSVGG
jgi:exonuclease SbcC